MKPKRDPRLVGACVVLFLFSALLQSLIDPTVKELHKGEKSSFQGLSNEFILGPMLGLGQAVAGALWVRADEFFHEGDYDAILPIVRMVTWLDPHQLDVYITGSWHLAYNFTDSSERSDRRYIPAAQRLLEEGDENNKDVYDIAFELGWQNSDKIKNYDRAEYWYRQASGRKGANTRGEATEPAPMFVWHQLAHSLERQGRIDEANVIWRKCLGMTAEKLKTNPKDFSLNSVHSSEFHNLELNLKRQYSRNVHAIDFDLDKKVTKSVDPNTGEPNPRDAYLATDAKLDGVPVGEPRLPATANPFDTAFETVREGRTRIKFEKSKVMDIKGVMGVGDGARVYVKLHDDNWKEKQLTTFKFEVDQSQTIMQDMLSVRGRQWGRVIDMSKDPKMYSFSRPYFYLVLEFNPRVTSPFIQDKFGWSGEGLTDKKYLWIEKSKTPEQKDIRMVRKVYKISREQIMGTKPVTEADVVTAAEYDRVIKSEATK